MRAGGRRSASSTSFQNRLAFIPSRSQHDALRQYRQYAAEG